MKKNLSIPLIITLFLTVCPPSFAAKDDTRIADNELRLVHNKLLRRVTNVVTAPLEIPFQTKSTVQASKKGVPQKMVLALPGIRLSYLRCPHTTIPNNKIITGITVKTIRTKRFCALVNSRRVTSIVLGSINTL